MNRKPGGDPLPPWREYLLDQPAARYVDAEVETGYHVGYNLTDIYRLFGKPEIQDPGDWIRSNPEMISGVTGHLKRMAEDQRRKFEEGENGEPWEAVDWRPEHIDSGEVDLPADPIGLMTHGVIRTWPVEYFTDGTFDHVIPGHWRDGDIVCMWEIVARLYAWYLDYQG